jgi:hypothetical protein
VYGSSIISLLVFILVFINAPDDRKILLSPETVEKAKKILGREFDVYVVESEWLKWIEGKEVAKTTDGAFIGFCKNKIVK